MWRRHYYACDERATRLYKANARLHTELNITQHRLRSEEQDSNRLLTAALQVVQMLPVELREQGGQIVVGALERSAHFLEALEELSETESET